ncbi:MAG: type II secretion system F family protein [Burkholderiales bacterium]|jgi:type IV pilus assembly protein PilC|nr:type II secretion system F family protein [Betaproteobacteria bacterium]
MATFSYRAVNHEGQIQTGNLDASNAIDLELRLKKMELDLIRFESIKKSALSTARRITRKELITFCFHMDQLLRAGVPIIEALSDLRDTVENPAFKQVVATLLEDIEGGLRLSEAMANHPHAFDTVFIALIRTGERSGQLPEVLTQLTENLKWQDELASQVKKAMMYPLFAGTIIVGVVFLLMIFLVPQLAITMKALTDSPPKATLALIAVSAFMQQFWYLCLGLPIVSGVILFILAKTNEDVRYQIDAMLLKLPVMGPLTQKIILARFSTYFALMYKSGLGVLDCIEISEKIVGNRVVEQGLQRVGREISDGTAITQAFQNARLFPPLVLRMLKVGESTGGLDTALLNVSYFYNREVKETMSSLQELIKPALTVILGGVLIGILITIFLPMYDVIAKTAIR